MSENLIQASPDQLVPAGKACAAAGEELRVTKQRVLEVEGPERDAWPEAVE